MCCFVFVGDKMEWEGKKCAALLIHVHEQSIINK